VSKGPVTAAAIISYATALEARSADFYLALAGRFPAQGQTFEAFAQACHKSGAQITRTYQETVTDALETGFAFPDLSLDAYEVDLDLPDGIDLENAVQQATALEQRAIAFYQDVGEQSASLLAAIARAFKRAARVRRRRLEKLL
jgi:hypothetical protein